MIARLALAALTLAALTACGRTASPQAVAPIDSVFTRSAEETAAAKIGAQLQQREDADNDAPETSRVTSRTSDATGMRRD